MQNASLFVRRAELPTLDPDFDDFTITCTNLDLDPFDDFDDTGDTALGVRRFKAAERLFQN